MEAVTEPHLVRLSTAATKKKNETTDGPNRIRTNRLVGVNLPELAPRFKLLDDGHRGLVVGHQSLSNSLLVVVYAAAA